MVIAVDKVSFIMELIRVVPRVSLVSFIETGFIYFIWNFNLVIGEEIINNASILIISLQ